MVKHVITMDYEDLEAATSLLTNIRLEVKTLEDSLIKTKIMTYVKELEDRFGIHSPPLPDVLTARWKGAFHDPMTITTHVTCSNCNHREVLYHGAAPVECPNCKAVMIGVE